MRKGSQIGEAGGAVKGEASERRTLEAVLREYGGRSRNAEPAAKEWVGGDERPIWEGRRLSLSAPMIVAIAVVAVVVIVIVALK
jgi:hypothetical protein